MWRFLGFFSGFSFLQFQFTNLFHFSISLSMSFCILIHSFHVILQLIHSLPKFNLPIIGAFMWLMPPGPYRDTTCAERKLTMDHIYTFLPHKDMEGLPGWGINSMPGPPLRQHKHERRYTTFTHPFMLTRWMKGWLWQPNDIRGPCGPKASWPKKLVSTGESNPGPLCDRHSCYHTLHSGGPTNS